MSWDWKSYFRMERSHKFGGKVVKNSSGYDLKDLIIGSEGTLGFITKAILKVTSTAEKGNQSSDSIPDIAAGNRYGTCDHQIQDNSDSNRIHAARSN